MLNLGQILIACASGWYLILITIHYTNQLPLWLDEWSIYDNIQRMSLPQLFSKPLDHTQAFPRCYLFVIKIFSSFFNTHLLALKLFPYIAMAVAFGVWLNIAFRQLTDKSLVGLVTLCWAASIPLIYYAAELKQYSMDVLVSGVSLWMLMRGFSRWWYIMPLACFFSYPSIFWVPLFLWNLMQYGRTTQRWQPLGIYAGILLVVVMALCCFDLRYANSASLITYWHDYFISFESLGEFFRSFGEGINNLISRWFAEKPKWIRAASRGFIGLGLGYMLVSGWQRFKTEKFVFQSVIPAACAVMAGHIVLGALHKYLFVVPRTSLFFAPMLMIATAMALQSIKARFRRVGVVIQSVMVGYLLIVSAGIGMALIGHHELRAQTVLFAPQGL